MILGHMGETHTDEMPAQFIILLVLISAHVCYNFIYKCLIDQVIPYTQICIRKCNITALIFLKALNVGQAEFQWNSNVITIPSLLKQGYN